MEVEDAILTLNTLGYDVLIKHDVNELGHIHVMKGNQTWVLYSFDELIDFAERK